MLTASKDGATITLRGTIDEGDDFNKILDPLVGTNPQAEMVFSCGEVTRINSVGVKNWMKYFSEVMKSSPKTRFEQLSVALVEQLNIVKNFVCGAKVGSVHLPYKCAKCDIAVSGAIKVDAIPALNGNIPSVKCAKCGGQADFDDLPDEYFSFLGKS